MANDLAHLKIIEIASVLAGPSVGLFFAEMGARVIKIENKLSNGDVTRSWKLPTEDQDNPISAYFASVNWGKEHLFLNLADEQDCLQLQGLMVDADVLITNFKYGDAEKFGLSYAILHPLFPDLIIGEITGFGSDSDRVAYDLILQAESGFMSMNGNPESGPVKMPVALIDILAGHQLKTGLMTALYQRDALKKGGCLVSVSLYDSAIASLANQATNWLMGEIVPKRMGSKHPNIAPYGELFKTKDGIIITFAIGSDRQFQQLCEVIELEELADHPNFSTNQNRVKNRSSLSSYLQDGVGKCETNYLLPLLHEKHVPVASIKNLKEVFNEASAQKLILEEDYDGIPTKRVKSVVYRIER